VDGLDEGLWAAKSLGAGSGAGWISLPDSTPGRPVARLRKVWVLQLEAAIARTNAPETL
jgi:hypothetical protein